MVFTSAMAIKIPGGHNTMPVATAQYHFKHAWPRIFYQQCDFFQRKLPARARVIRQRIPNAYDDKALRLEVSTGLKSLFSYFSERFACSSSSNSATNSKSLWPKGFETGSESCHIHVVTRYLCFCCFCDGAIYFLGCSALLTVFSLHWCLPYSSV